MDSNKALELAKAAYPNDENLRVAYMLGVDRGYELHREDMLKDAVEGYVRNGYPFNLHPYVDIEESKDKWCDIMHKNFMDGDKVRLIIVKED